MLSKNIDEKVVESDQNKVSILDHASDLSKDLVDDERQVSEEILDVPHPPKNVMKNKRKEKSAPKVVRRSGRLSYKK